MKSLNDYLQIYRSIAENQNLYGDTAELLANLLANASYINEVENISYALESMLERALLLNSKILHCVDRMYSVYRGTCPKVILNFYSQQYLKLQPGDIVLKGRGWNLYYLGYYLTYQGEVTDEDLGDLTEDDYRDKNGKFIYSSCIISPDGDRLIYKIICILSKEPITRQWSLQSDKFYYETLEDNLSNDVSVILSNTDYNTTVLANVVREFQDYLLDENSDDTYTIFDLTITGYGSRLYIPKSYIDLYTNILATYYKLSSLSDYTLSDLLKIKLTGTIPCSFSQAFLNINGYEEESSTGILLISEIEPDSLNVLHYRANRNRFASSIIRSNSDVGYLLEEMYPSKIVPNGTSFVFSSPDPTKKVITAVNKIYDLPNTSSYLSGTLSNYSDITFYNTSDDILSYNYSSKLIDNNSSYSNCIRIKDSVFTDQLPESGIIRLNLPSTNSGTLKLIYKSGTTSTGTLNIYTMLPSVSRFNSDTKTININIMKSSSDSETEILNTLTELSNYNLKLTYKYQYITSDTNLTVTSSEITCNNDLLINFSDLNGTPLSIELYLYLNDTKISNEVISRIDEENPEVLDLTLDTVFLESDSTGKLNQEFPIKLTNAYYYLYSNSTLSTVTPTFLTLSLGKVNYEITSDGLINLLSISDDINQIDIPIIATYNGNTLTKILNVKKSIIINDEDLISRDFYIGTDITGVTNVSQLLATTELQTSTINIEEGYQYLYIWVADKAVDIFDIQWEYKEESIVNTIESNLTSVSTLDIYYIPSTNSYLSRAEIEDFISKRSSYFTTTNINILAATLYTASIKLNLQLLQTDSDLDSKITEIFEYYLNKLNINLNNKISEITSSISKISNISSVSNFEINYYDLNNNLVNWSDIEDLINISYFNINYTINTTLV